MKKFIIFLSLFLISMFSYSQKFYAGAYYSEKTVVRPYIYYRFNTSGTEIIPGITGQQPHIKPNLGIFYSF